MDLGDPDGSGFDPVLGEHAGGEAFPIRVDQAEVQAVGFWVLNSTRYRTAQKAAGRADTAFDSGVRKIHMIGQTDLILKVLQPDSFQISYH